MQVGYRSEDAVTEKVVTEAGLAGDSRILCSTVDLDPVTGSLSLVASGMNFADSCSPRRPVRPIPFEDKIDAGTGYLDAVIADQLRRRCVMDPGGRSCGGEGLSR